jgi:hypothetical protein
VNGANVGTNSSTYNYSPSNGDLVTVIVNGNGSCTFGNPATSNTITMVVGFPTGVGLTIAANPGNFICLGTLVTFTATPSNGGPAPVYQWKLNGGHLYKQYTCKRRCGNLYGNFKFKLCFGTEYSQQFADTCNGQ